MAPTATFSTLPLGPLGTVVLYLTVADMAQLIGTNKEMNTSALDSPEFWRERCCGTFGRHVDYIESVGKNEFLAFHMAKVLMLPGESKTNSRLPGTEAFERSVWTRQLLSFSVGASSQDRNDEGPSHTLFESRCARMLEDMRCGKMPREAVASIGKRCQSDCGCVWLDKCYWSSEPSPTADKEEWLDYDMQENTVAVAVSFMLTPYTSFWQPEQPTYNPIEACFQLMHPQIDGGKTPYYESPRFFVDPHMKRQQFNLPRPIVSFGGRVRIRLLGMAQRQTLPESVGATANHYHTCISYAALCGTFLLSCSIANHPDGPASRSAKIPPVATIGKGRGGGGGGGGGEDVDQGGGATSPINRIEKNNDKLRMRWAVLVHVYPANKSDNEAALDNNGEKKPLKVKVFGDTPCLELLELYSKMYFPDEERARLVLAGGMELPAEDGKLVGEFAVHGKLSLVDPSRQ
ncbi:conserved unknown protein [Ectocarpus siliculosus]|uniref:F-box domain-containing protein n=1 Tax=Ectocarpus siliculosus TaxID=2880 RepID=D8LQM8_ECTSI|nr:conserved unknown protein [Ectocarpus siliculosus]|eukprot:CBN78792.1 conserved unknown protein [Ectocarpus siliculosus]